MESLNNNVNEEELEHPEAFKDKKGAACPLIASSKETYLEEVGPDEEIQTTSVPNTNTQLDVSSSRSERGLARVDPILDFWLVDEELVGRFSISTYHSDQAIIFKIKCTSPYSFWVKPIYGLMKPNVLATVEVKCDPKVSQAKVTLEEFLVETAAVPVASAVMTSDVYTSSLPSNLPELLSIWEQIENSACEKEDGNVEPVGRKESHRIHCRFQGTSHSEQHYTNNNNEKSWESKESRSSSGGHYYYRTEPECYLAREQQSETHPKLIRNELPSPTRREGCCCSGVRRLQALATSLAALLIASLLYICFHRTEWDDYQDIRRLL